MSLRKRSYLGERRARRSKKEDEIQKLYTKWFENVEVNIFSLTPISKEIEKAIASGDPDKMMPGIVRKWREN